MASASVMVRAVRALRWALAAGVMVATAAAPGAAWAQGTGSNGRCAGASNGGASAGSREQTFCFEPEAVQGSLVGAQGQRVQPLRRTHSASLLRVRAHFVPEMLRSIENF